MVLEDYSTWFITIAALLGGYAFVFGFLRRVNEWYYVGFLSRKTQYPLPPGDMGWPLLGHLPRFFKAFKFDDPDSFISDLYSRYGKTGMYRTNLFGCPSVIVCTPELCQKILTNDEQVKVGYPTSTMVLTGKKSLHGISPSEHKRLRRLTASSITGQEALSFYVDLIDGASIKVLDKLSSMEKPCEFFSELRKFAFEIITTIFFGSDVNHDQLDSVESLYIDFFKGLNSLSINLPGFAFHKALKARAKLIKVLQSILDRKRENSNETKTKKYMMDLLMEVEDEEGKKLEDDEITELILIFLLAGHESSAHGVLWSIIYLMENPHVFQRAKKEQEEILESRPSTQKGVTLNEVKQMKYLSNVIDEMLRRTNMSFSTFRLSKSDININGYTIPKGWKVLIWNRAVHMDPEIYPNPKDFDPSRWENYRPRPGSFLSFGLGSRLCPGANLAKLEISIFLHHFLLNYTMERINPKCPVTYLPVPSPSDNCLARIIKVK